MISWGWVAVEGVSAIEHEPDRSTSGVPSYNDEGEATKRNESARTTHAISKVVRERLGWSWDWGGGDAGEGLLIGLLIEGDRME